MYYLNEVSNYDLAGVGETIKQSTDKKELEKEASKLNSQGDLDSPYYYLVQNKPMHMGRHISK